ncbi:MAG: erythromycin esterase family protein [Eubacterium sp.]|nr:erythromycin esterase family protein [Eubacterium sp.]
MKKIKIAWWIGICILLAYLTTLCILRFVNPFTAERKIDGIENIGTSFQDFEIPTDVKVVGIGEGTHGNSEFQTIKLSVFQKMVQNGSCHSIAFEMTAGQAAIINDAIHNSDSDLEAIMAENDYPIYDTQEIIDMLTWMRDYNMAVPYEESLIFYGVDMQGGYRSLEYLQGLCSDSDVLKSNLSEEEINQLISYSTDNNDYENDKDFFTNLRDRFAANEDCNSKLIASQLDILIQYIEAPSFNESPDKYANYRDSSMANNLMTYYKIEEARGYGQILITAHNGHVMKGNASANGYGDSSTMGGRIDELFEGSYFCIGTDFYKGVVNIHTAGTFDDQYERADHEFCSDDPLAYQAKYFNDNIYCLDFTKINESQKNIYNIIHDYTFTGMIGEGYNPANDINKSERIKIIPADRYDAMIYYYEVTPIDPINY